MNYKEKSNWTLGENEPNSKPNKANLKNRNQKTEVGGQKAGDRVQSSVLAMTCAKDLNRALGTLKKEIIERIEK